MSYKRNKIELEEKGCSVISEIYSGEEINQLIHCIEKANQTEGSFLKTSNLFAIRQLIKNVPELSDLLFNEKMKELIYTLSGSDSFLTKAIYFNKPKDSNWFVAYHQDLSITVNKKADIKDYVNWTQKKNQIGVQPPVQILDNAFTIRIHLDKTDKNNGALRVIPKSHLNGIVRSDSMYWKIEDEHICEVEKGGVMLMKPLTLHASNRTTNNKQRRVVHLEFNNQQLENPLKWKEYFSFKVD